jgi:tRNA threonylcarbamoyladenosine biosynthesis protein TsaE
MFRPFSIGATMRLMQTEWVIKTEAELPQLATAVLEKLTAIQVKSGAAAVLALHGDLGAGKTTFMQTLANSLGVSEEVTSPTFVVMKQYMLEEQAWDELVHMDAYRIEDIDELGPLRFSELLERNDVILGVEWAEHIAAALPAHTLHLTFTIEGAVRKVHIDGAD